MLVRPAPAPVRNPSAALSSTDSRRSDSPPREAALPPSESMESRRLPPRDRFVMRHGSKLHSYDRDKVPYPASYNREDLELALLDHQLIRSTKRGSGTFIDFAPGEHPRRCLELACGMGAWIIAAARDWPDCTFVGYDLMNVQIPLWVLEDDVAARIEWVHGNLLRQRLPFDDEEFDYVHINGLAFAVPENKWISVYEELRRVMRTGGIIEQVEEDAIFPVLPRWFTEPLHAHVGGSGTYYQGPGGSPRFPPPSPMLERRESDEDDQEGSHEHAFLESLFNDVFENRFINRVPSSCLPNYFTAIFGQAMIPPVLQFPMPPLAPLAPLPVEFEGQAHLSASRCAPRLAHEQDGLDGSVDSLLSTAHSETDSGASASSVDTSQPTPAPDTRSPLPPAAPANPPGSPSPSMKSTRSTRGSNGSRPSLRSRDSGHASAPHRDSYSLSQPNGERPSVPSGDLRTEDSTSLGDTQLFPMETILSLPEHSLNMQLFRALGLVMSVKEAMWEELCERVAKAGEGRRLREECGWEDADFAEGALREKFEGWVERYRSDIRARVSLWYSMVLSGWQYPRKDPTSRAEMLEEERLRQDILEARKHAKGEDLMGYSRSIRLLVGTKVRMDSMS
ncbi:hypothetical protein FOMPIDRAFT_56317 [Fomitopsis schrenkii]|uniref:Methyltransferase domain-containing protein n=1 Tax=Fomitopsis schrenkii TaxID=2126942 RepID=S8FJ87_FOMSC|nr:hypothetical protein FOMPIDRAFT_56317 [Fomitopsis schrenkii]